MVVPTKVFTPGCLDAVVTWPALSPLWGAFKQFKPLFAAFYLRFLSPFSTSVWQGLITVLWPLWPSVMLTTRMISFCSSSVLQLLQYKQTNYCISGGETLRLKISNETNTFSSCNGSFVLFVTLVWMTLKDLHYLCFLHHLHHHRHHRCHQRA